METDDILVKPQSTYINPYTDFGFKKLFGEEGSKDLLIDFLNQLLPNEYKIMDLEFRNTEFLPETTEYRKAIFDLYCENEKKDKFVIEMQKSRLEYFKDRAILYTSFPIRNQVPKGKVLKIVKGEETEVDWNYKLKPVYFVGILDFEFDNNQKDEDYVLEVEYKDQYNKVFYNKLKYFFVIMPRFNKKETNLVTQKDKWLYFLKNLSSFDKIPDILNQPIFKKGFDLAKIANYTPQQLTEYQKSYNDYLDWKASMEFQFKDGVEKGKIEGIEIGKIEGIEIGKLEEKMSTVIKLIKKGITNEDIAEITELTILEIDKIRTTI